MSNTGGKNSSPEHKLDFDREQRLGFGEAIFCAQKSTAQINQILAEAQGMPFLLTRLTPEAFQALAEQHREHIDYDAVSQTGFHRFSPSAHCPPQIAVVTAGTTDAPTAREAVRTLEFNNLSTTVIYDVGVAGIWRLMERIDEIRSYPIIISVAGMDAALTSVLGGLVQSVIIAVPTSTGYGTAKAGETALNASLASCAPGVTVCNIDNGYGAACAAIRVLTASRSLSEKKTPTIAKAEVGD